MSVEKFLLDIHEHKCPFGIQDENEIEDIESAVKDAIKNICENLASKDPRLYMSDALPAGGYYEETKIENPNEFDYMVVCDNVSLETEFKMTNSCQGCVTLSPHHRERWKEFCLGEAFCFAPTKHVDCSEAFISFNDYFEMVMKYACEEVEKCILKTTGNLHLVGAGGKSLSVGWESFSNETMKNNPDFGLIDVDIMPCIRIPEDQINQILKEVPSILHKYVRNDGCHIVPKNCGVFSEHFCCQVSFSRCELFMIREMSQHHIKCYKILKVISKTLSALCFDSYAIKTSILHHCYIEGCIESGYIHSCILNVLEYLKETSRNKFLPNIFLPSKNVWEHSMVGTDAEISRFYKAQAGLADLVIEILMHISEINIHEYSLQSCLNLFEKLERYLGKLSNGDLVFMQVEKKMKTFLRKRKGGRHNRCSVL
ncbi:cyclic GMP-AMP synthase-like receptor 1 [Mytilus edulis]|uniref:cyclic GMP-AMP synthase-like receptor 1 n=1 Tax=Mytilus edulis TaxID=6550 RepID=UPI0039EDFAA9